MKRLLCRLFLLFIANGIISSSCFSQIGTSNKIYATIGTGTTFLNDGGATLPSFPDFLIGVGYKNLSIESNYYFDIKLSYSELKTANKVDFISPYGTTLNKNWMENLNLRFIFGRQFSRFSVGTGMDVYVTLDSKSEFSRHFDSMLISSNDSFRSLKESKYKNFGIALPVDLEYQINHSSNLTCSMGFAYVDGFESILSRGLRYSYLTIIHLGLKRSFN